MSQGSSQFGFADSDALRARAEQNAASLLVGASKFETSAARRRRRQINALINDAPSREFLIDLTDQVLRIGSRRRAAQRFHDLVAERGLPSFASGIDRTAVRVGGKLAPTFPRIVMGLTVARMRHELAGLVLPAEQGRLTHHVRRRAAQSIRLNVNLLGEAVLGEGEAKRRAESVIELLDRPEVNYISVKITSICSRLDVLAYEHSLHRVIERLRPIYQAAARYHPAKFVNLDMEEYRDLQLTVDAFTRLLVEPELATLDAGIVLQAYLPDSFEMMNRLAVFARERHANYGSSIKVRLVKGANLAMEQVEAELQGWQQAPFATKAEVDASYKRLLDLALEPANAGALRIGVASHNLFDVGWAMTLDKATGQQHGIELEMLEGMAEAQALATADAAGGLLLYAPVVRRDDFESAVAYLVRRFDENTAPENFLAHLFELTPQSSAWQSERHRFERSVEDRLLAAPLRRRRQDRFTEEASRGHRPDRPFERDEEAVFCNEPDTDFTLEQNRDWLFEHVRSWVPPIQPVPASIAGMEFVEPASGVGIDPSNPLGTLYRYVQADEVAIDRAVHAARRAAETWQVRPAIERRSILYAVAEQLSVDRGRAIATMMHDAGKTAREADPEVSEAIDFARYYGDQSVAIEHRCPEHHFAPYKVVVVAPPWNFPYSIPAGGVIAALAAGSAVILKPAPESVLTAWEFARSCWAAGVPRDVLQFVPTADDKNGRRLITHEDVDAVILTGAYETGRLFLGWRPNLALHAETSGKNSLIVTAAADQDDAIRDLVRSAFAHAGQKCSAASLAIVEGSVYDDPHFRARLADAVLSLRVGPSSDLASEVGPLIRPPEGPLLKAFCELSPGEEWLVRPEQLGNNPHLWRPGVKIGVTPGSDFHLTECFGPVLGVMRARDLNEAIEMQNTPTYGLTGGIHTLDEREVERWLDAVEVGNAYVNRHITGAIVRRQPFGGWKRSTLGGGVKAGGPHYVSSLGRWSSAPATKAAVEIEAATQYWRVMAAGMDPSGLRAERNELRLRAFQRIALRLSTAPDPVALEVALGIAAELDVVLDLSAAQLFRGLPLWATVESEVDFVERIKALSPQRTRLFGCPSELRLLLLDAGFDVDIDPLCAVGVFELLHWTREQAISETLHRHGNIRSRIARSDVSGDRTPIA